MKVALVNPSSPLDQERLELGKTVLREICSQSLTILEGKSMGKTCGYLAGNDEERIDDLDWAFGSDADIVWLARGGFGTTRLLDRLNWSAYAASNKRLIGFSDATALLTTFAAHGGGAIHGPMVAADLSLRNERTIESLQKILIKRETDEFEFVGEMHSSVGGSEPTITGEILAGNLVLFSSLAGTKYFPQGKGQIIFLEEVNEEPYRIDRLLTQLIDSGLFEGAKAVVFGSMSGCVAEDPSRSFTTKEVQKEFSSRTKLPVVTDFPFGHEGANTLLPLGGKVELRPGPDGRISAQVFC
ncbi:MAG: LD-carboxypeptidase [Candidatus Lindowbacteria bacterium]|nr:LD-carboxypeptidase [Candidatus Lindowbacteria bacterium]